MDGFAIAKEEGEQINFRGTRMLVKVSNDDSEGRYSLIEMTHPLQGIRTGSCIPFFPNI
jgi:hypothetical protein